MRSVPGGSRVLGRVLKGKVLRVYLPDDPDHPGTAAQTVRVGALGSDGQVPEIVEPRIARENRRGIVCDVLVFGDGRRTLLKMVPVFPGRGGRNDSDRWIPQGTRNSVAGSGATATKMLAAGDPAQAITQPKDLDGDTVLVEFLDGDYQHPFIRTGCEHWHPEEAIPAYRVPSAAQGPANERTIRHRGSKVRIDSDGSVEIDATGASSGVLDDKGAEVTGALGTITIKAKANQIIRIEGGNGAAGRIELVPTGGVAAADVATVGSAANAPMPVTLTPSANEGWFEVLPLLGGLIDATGLPVPPNLLHLGATWSLVCTAMAANGLASTITTGNSNVRTD